jgi:hypothetical protein
MKLAPLLILAALMAGCGSRTIFVPGDAPVRLAEDVQAYTYVVDPETKKEVRGTNRQTIPAGYVAFPPALLHRPATSPAR